MEHNLVTGWGWPRLVVPWSLGFVSGKNQPRFRTNPPWATGLRIYVQKYHLTKKKKEHSIQWVRCLLYLTKLHETWYTTSKHTVGHVLVPFSHAAWRGRGLRAFVSISIAIYLVAMQWMSMASIVPEPNFMEFDTQPLNIQWVMFWYSSAMLLEVRGASGPSFLFL